MVGTLKRDSKVGIRSAGPVITCHEFNAESIRKLRKKKNKILWL